MEEPFELSEVLEYNGTLWVNEEDPASLWWVQAALGLAYGAILVVGTAGNCLVLAVVARSRPARSVAALFVANHALAHLLLCLLCLPFTPLYAFVGRWVLGGTLCRVVVLAQGTALGVSSASLAVVCGDRYWAVARPMLARPRTAPHRRLVAAAALWLVAAGVALPAALHARHRAADGACEQRWGAPQWRAAWGGAALSAQLVAPLVVAGGCCAALWRRLRPAPRRAATSGASVARLLVALVAAHAACWLPLELLGLTADLSPRATRRRFFHLAFCAAHALATSSACYAPFLYAWLNANFRREFRRLLPCCCGGGARSGEGDADALVATCEPGQPEHALLPESEVGIEAVPVVSYRTSGDVVQFSTDENLLDISPSI